jgi:hypothetical protein
MKELKIMKALRYLLIVMGLMSVLSISAQALAQQPEVYMQSTSGMVYSGSQLPSAAADGAVLTGSTVGTYTPASAGKPSGPRKIGGGNQGGGDGPSNPVDPWATPLGDAAWPLVLMALSYMAVRTARKRKGAVSK